MSHVLAIDLGTGTAKAALVGAGGVVAAHAMRPVETIAVAGGGVEQDPEAWWSAVRDFQLSDKTALVPFAWIVEAKLILTDELMKRGAEQRAARMNTEDTTE